jgi:acyl carrier protein
MSDTSSGHESLPLVFAGIVLARLFPPATAGVTPGLPTLAEVLRKPAIAREPLASLGLDSLAWLEVLTTLESELGLEIGNDFLVDGHVSAELLGEALSRALSMRVNAAA